MSIKILLDTPNPDSLQYRLEEMADDPFVGRTTASTKEAWVDFWKKRIHERKLLDIQSTVAYNGSGIVGIAFSRPLAEQSQYANMKEENDYWKMGHFYVLKKYRGQGIGKRALEFFLEAKDRKVFYFADRNNVASNAVAKANGMFWLHDFMSIKMNGKNEVCAKNAVVRTPADYYRVYCGLVPPKDQLVNPRLTKPSYYPNK